MQIIESGLYILLGIFAFAIAIYLIFSPFALIIGLFNPRAVLDDKKPQTRFRVLKSYGITTAIVLTVTGFGAFSNSPAEETVYATPTYSAPNIATSPVYTTIAKASTVSYESNAVGTWVNVRND